MLPADHAAVMSVALNRWMGRVLLVDGDNGRRVALASALEAGMHEVEIAASAVTGTYVARVSRPDLVIVESVLPDGTSAELCAALRREPLTSRMLVMVMSSSMSEGERVAAFEAGADELVARPFSIRELLLRIRALLRRVQRAPTVGDHRRGRRADRSRHASRDGPRRVHSAHAARVRFC